MKNYRDSDAIRNAFGLVAASGETYLLNAIDPEMKNAWMNRIQKILNLKQSRLEDVEKSEQEIKVLFYIFILSHVLINAFSKENSKIATQIFAKVCFGFCVFEKY